MKNMNNFAQIDPDSEPEPGDLFWLSMHDRDLEYYIPAIYVCRPLYLLRERRFTVYLPTLAKSTLTTPHNSRLHILIHTEEQQ